MKKRFSVIASQLPDHLVELIEDEADARAASISHGDPYNELGMAEAEDIAQAMREDGRYIEPFLLLAYEHRQEYADAIWAELAKGFNHIFYTRIDGKKSVVIAAEDECYANLLHKVAADIIDLPCYVQSSCGKTAIIKRKCSDNQASQAADVLNEDVPIIH